MNNTNSFMAAQPVHQARNYRNLTAFMLFASLALSTLVFADLSQRNDADRLHYTLAIIWCALFIGASVFSLFRATQNFHIVKKLEKEGYLLKAKITNKWIDIFKGEKFFRISYKLKEDMEIWETVTAGLFKELETENDVLIRSLEKMPEIARLEKVYLLSKSD